MPMLYYDGLNKIRRALSLKKPPAPAISTAPCGINIPYCVESGLSEEDCTKILAENGYNSLESFVPKEGPFKLFVPEGRGGWNYMTFQDGKQQAHVTMDWGLLSVLANIPAENGKPGYYTFAFMGQAFCGEWGERREALYIASDQPNAQAIESKGIAVPWNDRFSQAVKELSAACNAAAEDWTIPRFAPAIKDLLLPCEAQREPMYRRLPDVRVAL